MLLFAATVFDHSVVPLLLRYVQVHEWAYGIGYLLVYGTILAKMWRVYQIFHDPNPNKMVPSKPTVKLLMALRK